MTLLDYLREDLVPLMKRREKVGLRSVRDAIAAIENAATEYREAEPVVTTATQHVAASVPFGQAERYVRTLTDAEMMALARGEVTRRLDDAVHYRGLGDVDRALMLKAEALTLADRLDAYPPDVR